MVDGGSQHTPDCTDWRVLSRVATPLKDPNQQNKYRDPPNIYIIPNFRFKKSNNIYVLYISCTGKQEMRINLRQKRIKWCLLWPAQNGGYSPEQATYSGAHKIALKNFSEIFHINMDQNTTHKGRRAITKYKHCHGQSNLHKNL